jgi:hypothetical protein
MPIRNQHWYNLNEAIDFPIDDRATAIDDAGARLPSNILVDLSLRWPAEKGSRAFIGGVTVSANAVSVTILACQDETSTGGFVPLAAVTVRKPVDESRQYAIVPLLSGVAGWIAFGSGVAENAANATARFSTPRQSLLAARTARPYRTPTVSGVRSSLSGTPLTGVVKLQAEPPLKLSKQERVIEGKLRDCIVVELADDGGAPEDNVFERFIGPCAKRPESGTCERTPIEYVNAVGPDCNGVLTLEFVGCALPSRMLTPRAIVLDCGLGLSSACNKPYLPDENGNLPGDIGDSDSTSGDL